MVKRAVLIGINYIGSDNALRGCINDIRNIYKRLTATGFTEFIILHDGGVEDFPEAQDVKMPTGDNIRAALKQIISDAHNGDTVFWHYSGHGSNLADQMSATGAWARKDEKDGRDETICPVDYDPEKPDAGFIRDDELRWILCEHDKNIKLRVVLDCCHSGTGLDLPYMWRYYTRSSEESSPLDKDVIFISGCKDDQTSADAQDDAGDPSGALTWALLKSLKEIDVATAKSKKPVKYTWKDLVELIRYKLRRGGYDQIPQLCVCKKLDVVGAVDL